ncbi:hypothetical protein [Candidatus Avelusimicrobium luingense]|uniref:hypothetical protein n=1 Tax=Candidatus Avelusimicrobium luingense TaxID=3416211 RepID=UPI003D097DC0
MHKHHLYLSCILIIFGFISVQAQSIVSTGIKGLERLSQISSAERQIAFLLMQNPQLSLEAATQLVKQANPQANINVENILGQMKLSSENMIDFSASSFSNAVENAIRRAQSPAVTHVKPPYQAPWRHGPEILYAQTKLFISENGHFPRLKIEDKTPDMYTKQDIQEIQLARRIRYFFASTEPNDPIVLALQEEQEKYAFGVSPIDYPSNYQSGPISRQMFSQEINRAPDARDLANDFPQWLLDNGNYMIPTPETTKAFESVRVAAAGNGLNDEIYDILVTLNAMHLGYSDKGRSVRVTYRGDNPTLPQAKDFHEVIEINGLTKWQPHAKKALQNDYGPIKFYITRDSIAGIFLEEGTTAADVARVFQDLCPKGFSVRMTPHEFGLQDGQVTSDSFAGRLHFHIEHISPSEGEGSDKPDISYTLWLNAQDLVQDKTPHQIFKLYRDLFRPYMDDYMVNFTL